MQTSIDDMIDELKDLTEYQQTPSEITDDQYESMIKYGIRRLYIDTGRYDDYDNSTIPNNGKLDLPIDEIEYAMILAQIRFFKKVQADVNEMVSYTTDALSVSNGDRPFVNLKNTIEALENERRILFYKMVRYAVSYTVSDDDT